MTTTTTTTGSTGGYKPGNPYPGYAEEVAAFEKIDVHMHLYGDNPAGIDAPHWGRYVSGGNQSQYNTTGAMAANPQTARFFQVLPEATPFAPFVPTRRMPQVHGTQGNCGMYEVTPVHDNTTEEFLKAVELYPIGCNYLFSDNEDGNGAKIAGELKAHGHIVESLVFPGKHGHQVRAWFFTKFKPNDNPPSAEQEDEGDDEDGEYVE